MTDTSRTVMKRYNAFTNYNMIESVDGQYVRYEDMDELLQAYSELLDDAIEERWVKFGDFRGGPEHYYREDIALRDRLKENGNGIR